MPSPAPSTSLGPSESVNTSQQVQLPQTSSEPATPRPCDDQSKTTTSSWVINLEEMSDEEILAREKRAIERSLMMNYGKLELPPKSDPRFKIALMEDGSVVRDDRADGSTWYPEWAWEMYGPKRGR
ncbi:hypothetical protein OIDMADRAFT_20760 [Oidiodendron maius Zn]|uniref:Uncharacterized protein n=1 Tax=Oidiodendron maius (strain Zn) TaxID=913774 RepID=A0A0C3GYV0_OIDMZ|nr:hypothetical protein OIDMADRAFT_20760 [Oidiodendron maius Zn]